MSSEFRRQASALKYGEHPCAIYENETERFAIVTSFIEEGLARGDRCLVIADQATSGDIKTSLAAAIDVARMSELGALRFSSQRDPLFETSGIDPEAKIDYLRAEQAQALADGFAGLWVIGEISQALGTEVGCHRLIKHECLLNPFLVDSQTVVICLYDRGRFAPAVLHDVLRTHPMVILGDHLCANPYYEPPELVLCQDTLASSEFKARRVDWWINRIRQAGALELEKDRFLEQLEVERARFKAVLTQMAAGVAIVEAPSGRLILANDQLTHILRKQPLSFQNIEEYEQLNCFHKDGTPYLAADWPAARSIHDGETVWHEEINVLRDDGSRGTICVSSTPIRDRSGAIILAVAICSDITQQKKTNESVQKYTAQLQGLVQASLKIHSAGSPTMVAQAVTEAAREIVGAHLCVTSFTADANWAQPLQCVSFSEKYAHWQGHEGRLDGTEIYSLVCEMSRPLRLTQAELEAHPQWREPRQGGRPPCRGARLACGSPGGKRWP